MPDTTNPKPAPKATRRTWTPATLYVQLEQFAIAHDLLAGSTLEQVFSAIEKEIVAEQTGGRR